MVDLVDRYDPQTGFAAMERLTGWHAAIMAALVFGVGLLLPGLDAVLRAGLMILVGMAAFTLTGMALGAFHPRDVLRQLRRRAPRGASPANPA